MDATQLLAMIILFSCSLVRPFVFRPIAKLHRATDGATIVGVWMLLGSALLFPFMQHHWYSALPALEASPWLLLISVSKGLVLWGCLALGQSVREHSNGAAEFQGLVTIGPVALLNMMLGETLAPFQLLCILAIALLSIVYVMFGELSKLPMRLRVQFLMLVTLGVLPSVTDQVVMTHTNWYIQFMFSSVGLCLAALLSGRLGHVVRLSFTQRACVLAGLLWVVTEVIILMLLITWVPVTLGALAMRMSVPASMMASYLLWNEGTFKQQLAFGCLALIFAVPLLF